jgi:putative ABC transport system permease protein
MTYRLLFNSAVRTLKANRNRTFLTILGIVIGISSVIVIMSVGAGAQSLLFNQFASVGTNLIGITPGYSDEKGPPASAMGVVITTLKNSDAEALKKIKEVEAVTAYVRGVDTAQYQNQKMDITFSGVTADYPKVEKAEVELGSFFDEGQDREMARVAVLGWEVWQQLFNGDNPIGEHVKIKNESFDVIGVLKKRGTQAFENKDDMVFVPLNTAQKLLLGIDHVSMIRLAVINDSEVPAALEEIKAVLRERHEIGPGMSDDFSARAAIQGLDALKQVTNALKFFLAGMAAISLIVGGVGIMNIMLVAVNERTREIGLRKAIGATSGNIQAQFLVEAATVTVLGGIIGIIFGFLISAMVALVAKYLGYAWDLVVTIPSILMGVGVAAGVGILFGWYPAKKAAGLEPVEALRYE